MKKHVIDSQKIQPKALGVYVSLEDEDYGQRYVVLTDGKVLPAS